MNISLYIYIRYTCRMAIPFHTLACPACSVVFSFICWFGHPRTFHHCHPTKNNTQPSSKHSNQCSTKPEPALSIEYTYKPL